MSGLENPISNLISARHVISSKIKQIPAQISGKEMW